ncbi:hypothetical protein D9611_002548 [Ephemerocybe angulata]|uniref:Uncharacterized protein n=1 Tax=Ephemerocybe angulata TaxID=980116 RepID=A0A8H5C2J5_9AGAR|nr:hypothetical protein D9611_002548 [Tulosesus angulatus]
MDSLLEVQRQTQEEIERFDKALYTILSRPNVNQEIDLQNAHKASQCLDRITARATALNALYEDEEARKTEIEALSSQGKGQDLTEFYTRLDKIRDHYKKYPDSSPGGGFDLEIASFLDEPGQEEEDFEEEDPIALLFSGEESYGRYVDLYTNHTAFSNIKNIGKRPSYLQYLDLLLAAQTQAVHSDLPKETRFTKDYETYIKDLHAYLLSFIKKAQPLHDVESEQRRADEEFKTKWEAGQIAGWEAADAGKSGSNGGAGIWCAACQKHYSKQTVYDAHLTSKKHIKASQKQATSNAPPVNPNGKQPEQHPTHTSSANTRLQTSAYYTHLTTSLIVTLTPVLNETKSNVERKFSLTAREREQELQEKAQPPPPPANADGTQEDEEEEERIYNPLKLPLGWDGKPIPYWLYKLHGLGVEYKCEICSDHVYMGRKNFDRHFQEARHAFGMRALGLPNTKHFHEITRIEDALALAEKLKQEGRNEIFEQETMEELEDDEGNVYNRKTYEDLKKQGII